LGNLAPLTVDRTGVGSEDFGFDFRPLDLGIDLTPGYGYSEHIVIVRLLYLKQNSVT
jgi:hypothetical protein